VPRGGLAYAPQRKEGMRRAPADAMLLWTDKDIPGARHAIATDSNHDFVHGIEVHEIANAFALAIRFERRHAWHDRPGMRVREQGHQLGIGLASHNEGARLQRHHRLFLMFHGSSPDRDPDPLSIHLHYDMALSLWELLDG